MWKKNIETFLGCDADYAEASVVLFGAPFDSTTSFRPGTRFGSSAIRHESYGLESYSPYQDHDITDFSIFDGGDLELPFGDPSPALEQIQTASASILQDNKIPFLLGGEHLVTLGSVRAAAMHFSDLHILHFDAHADLRDEYLGASLSHACVLRRCYELLGKDKIFQYGIRSGDQHEFKWANGKVFTHRFNFSGLENTLDVLDGKPVYLTVDLDVLDPSVFPGTGTPEPGGVSFEELRCAVTAACEHLQIIGADVNELSPHYDPSGISTATACKIVREMLIALLKNKGANFCAARRKL